MTRILGEIDRLIRGEIVDPEKLGRGEVAVDLRLLTRVALVLGLVYGVFMGLYAVCRPAHASMMALVATTLKVPLVFLFTFLVTFPSLYVFSTLFGSKCHFRESLVLLTAAMGSNLAVLASLGPITAFFTLSTDSYPFLVLLNIFFFSLSGLISLGILNRSIRGLISARLDSKPAEKRSEKDEKATIAATKDLPETHQGVEKGRSEVKAESVTGEDDSFARRHERRDRMNPPSDPLATVFRVWVIIYGIVGAQMGWILRPFVGAPALPFEWFRAREGSFLTGLAQALAGLFK